jgi:hypothetical protein
MSMRIKPEHQGALVTRTINGVRVHLDLSKYMDPSLCEWWATKFPEFEEYFELIEEDTRLYLVGIDPVCDTSDTESQGCSLCGGEPCDCDAVTPKPKRKRK